MDVARISAVSPRQIDWRNLTAKQIIKYERQGVDVPSVYLQWAQDFRATLDSNDETTYEMAQSTTQTTDKKTEESKVVDNSLVGVELSETSTPPDITKEEQNEINSTDSTAVPQDKSAAQIKREELQNANVSLRNQAKIFTGDSKENTKAAAESASIISSVQAQSVDEIQNLENYMSELLSKADAAQSELRSEVDKINSDKSDVSSLSKINKLQQQLQEYGNAGQTSISVSESEFNQFDSTIKAQTGSILSAQDFGSETIGIGNDLLTSIKGFPLFRIADYIAGKQAVQSGGDAVNQAEITADVQLQAESVNSENKSSAASYKGQVSEKTGVPSASLSNKENKYAQNGEVKESEKTIKTSENDGTDDKDKLNTDINEILKRKVRKGESLNA